MPWLKHRPKLELLSTAEVLCGEDLHAVVRILAKRRLRITGLSAMLVGYEEARFGSGEWVSRVNARGQGLGVDILGPGELVAGLHEHTFKITVPSHFAPSYFGQRCSTRYFLKLKLGVRGWFDRRASFEIAIGLRSGLAAYPGQPALFSSRAGGPEAKRPYLEGSVAGDVLAPGDVLRGAVALHNTEYNRYSRVVISLVGTERLHDKRSREEREVRRLSIDVDTKSPAEGQSFPLALRVPGNLAPSATAQLWSLHWALEIVARVRLGRDATVRLPLTVVPTRSVKVAPASRRPAPSVGSARMRALWLDVAQQLGLEVLGAHMRAYVGEVSMEILRQHRGRGGWVLVGQLRFESLRLQARIEESSIFRGTSFGGIKLGARAWDRHHHTSARSTQQCAPVFELLKPALLRFPSVSLSDTEATVVLRDSGLRRARLLEFCESVLELGRAVQRTRDVIPVPPEFEEAAALWRRFAATLDGRLEHGDMSIRGRFQGFQVETLHSWSDDGTLWESSIRVLGLRRAEGEDVFQLHARDGQAIAAEELSALPERQRELARAIEGARWFSSQGEELALALPPALEPEPFARRLPALARFAMSRVEAVGPYR